MPSDPIPNSLINLGELSKPATVLIEKISNAVGGICQPWQMKRVAKAEAEIAIVKTQTEIQVTGLQRRAMQRFFEEEARHQENIEDITAQALPQLNEGSKPETMENDWISNFFEKSRIVSDKEMQGLWARVLAGEANAPASYSKRTVNFLSDLDKSDARMFAALLGFTVIIGGPTPVVFDSENTIYNSAGVNFSAVNHLESIGLISFNSLSGYQKLGLPEEFLLTYFGAPIPMRIRNEPRNLEIGQVLLTSIGQELAHIVDAHPVDGFLAYLTEKWKAHMPPSSPMPTTPAAAKQVGSTLPAGCKVSSLES